MIRAVFIKGNFVLPSFGNIWEGRKIIATDEQIKHLEERGYVKRLVEAKKPQKSKKK